MRSAIQVVHIKFRWQYGSEQSLKISPHKKRSMLTQVMIKTSVLVYFEAQCTSRQR